MAIRKILRQGVEKETGKSVVQYDDGTIEYAAAPAKSSAMAIPMATPDFNLPSVSPGVMPFKGMVNPLPSSAQSLHPGAMIGSTLAEGLSIPVAPLAGPAAPLIPPLAAGLGGGVGEFVSQAAGDQPFNLSEKKRQAITQGVGSGAGRLLGAGISKGYSLISGGASPEATKAISYLSKKGLKQPLLPAEATDNRVLDLLDNISQNSLIGGGAIAKHKLSRKVFMEGLTDEILTAFGKDADPDIMGKLFLDLVDDNLKMSRVAANNMYNLTDDLLRPVTKKIPIEVPSSFVDRLGKPLMTQQMQKVEVMRAPVNISRLKVFVRNIQKTSKQAPAISAEAMGDDIVSEISAMPNTVDFAVAKDLKTRLMKKIDFFDVTDKTAPAKGIAKKGISMIDDAIENQLKGNHPEAYQMWRDANQTWKSTGEQFNNRFIRTMVRKVDPDLGGDPEMIVNSVFKSGRILRIQRVKNPLDIGPKPEGRDLWNKLKSWTIHDSFKKTTNKDGEIIGTALDETLFGRNGLGDKVLRETFTPDEIGNLKEFTNALKVIQARSKEGTGRIWIQLTQAGAVMGVLSGQYRKASIALLGGPYMLSRIFTNPKWSKRLIDGIKMSGNPQMFITAMNKLSAEVTGQILLPSQQMLPQEVNYRSTRPDVRTLPTMIGVE